MRLPRSLFITSVCSLGLALIAILYGCADLSGKPLSQTAYYFGTSCTLTLFSPKNSRVFNEVFNRFDELEKKMSSSLPGSEVSEINREAGVRPVPVSGDTFFVIQKGIEFERLTSGRFDISIGPIVKLWDIGGEKQRVPAADEIRDKLPLVGSAGIHLDGASGSVFLVKSGMMLDLGGIAKGYAADEAKKIIERSKVERAIVDIGGNIIVIGQKQGGRPWRIGVQNPFQSRGEYCGIVEMGEGTAVTSGTYERYFERDGKRYHHILDTATGYPVENSLMSVTIITKSSIKADALSTGVFALGLSDGMSLVEKLEGVEAIFVGRDRGVHLTSGIRDAFQLSDESFTLE